MIAFFSKQRFLKEEDEEWHLATWKWLLKNFGGVSRLRASPIVNATRAFFPSTEAIGNARGEHVFACIKEQAGMRAWPCELVAQPERIRTHVSEFVHLRVLENDLPLGTFRVENGKASITYDAENVSRPAILVATLIHELSHYALAVVREDGPGGEQMHEFATDLMTVFLGFGLFGANRAFDFSQHGDAFGQGWRMSTQGYLRERDWVFALAVFLNLRSETAGLLKKLLKPHLYSDLKIATRYLERNPNLLAEHRAIQTTDNVVIGLPVGKA